MTSEKNEPSCTIECRDLGFDCAWYCDADDEAVIWRPKIEEKRFQAVLFLANDSRTSGITQMSGNKLY
jgi:hypothetical protein